MPDILGQMVLGLGLFFIGMHLVGENLRHLSSHSFRTPIARFTADSVRGSLLGSLFGALMQSATERYRFNRWEDSKGLELYDLKADPRQLVNLAGDRRYAETVAACEQLLSQGWKAARPPAPRPKPTK